MENQLATPVERRRPGESPRGERRETIEEMSDTIALIQKMGQRLAYETHFDEYDQVAELNLTLHQARLQMDRIRKAVIRE